MSTGVVRALGRVARDVAHPGGASRCDACGRGEGVLAERADGVVVRHGQVVAKAHAGSTDPSGHRSRLGVAGHPLLAGILLPPLPAPAIVLPGARPVTTWPYGAPVDPADPDSAPWEAAGALAARLHSVPTGELARGTPLPPMRGPAKAARALARMRAAGPHPAAVPVERAAAGLPAWAVDEAPAPHATAPHITTPRTLCHGDLHLGQLVRHPAPDGPWLLIDIDDLGLGDPAWDLARPAAWYAAGLLPPDAWERFLGAYRSAGGPAVPADGDPWPRLDTAARALTVQTAALAVARSAAEGREPDEAERLMIDACARIGALVIEFGPGASS